MFPRFELAITALALFILFVTLFSIQPQTPDEPNERNKRYESAYDEANYKAADCFNTSNAIQINEELQTLPRNFIANIKTEEVVIDHTNGPFCNFE